MNVIAVNGSPRKDWNTGTLLKSALEGAESVGARTKLVHLYDLTYKGCTSCFSCKRKGNTCDGLCAMRDELRDVLAEALESDVLLLGSPVYFGGVTGEMRSFLERLLFPNASYDEFGKSTFARQVSCGFIFTMNCPEEFVKTVHYDVLIETHALIMGILKGTTEVLTSHETWQFEDYSAMNAAMFDVDAKAKRRAERFPVDRQKAFEMGFRLAGV
ncbi:MAG: flavodoxin [Actinobacteria bacterium RBG_16_64_13]|nr:MAG: flavodoxin [Actinobacteria bacterium RBG_16_64_13]